MVGADVTLRADRDGDALATPQFDVCLRGLRQLQRAQDLRGGDQARRRRRAGRHAAARAAAVRRQRADGEGARPARRVPLGHRVRLGGRLPVDAARRRAPAAVGPVSVAGRRRGVPRGGRQEQEHQGAGDRTPDPIVAFAHRRRRQSCVCQAKLVVVRRAIAVAARSIAGGPALAQQKLKWAHVYETSRAVPQGVGVGRRRDQEAHQRQVRHPGVPGVARSARKPTSTRA